MLLECILVQNSYWIETISKISYIFLHCYLLIWSVYNVWKGPQWQFYTVADFYTRIVKWKYMLGSCHHCLPYIVLQIYHSEVNLSITRCKQLSIQTRKHAHLGRSHGRYHWNPKQGHSTVRELTVSKNFRNKSNTKSFGQNGKNTEHSWVMESNWNFGPVSNV